MPEDGVNTLATNNKKYKGCKDVVVSKLYF